MKRNFLTLLAGLLLLTACSNTAQPNTSAAPTQMKPPAAAPAERPTAAPTQVPPSPTPAPQVAFKVVTEANPQSDTKTDIYLQDPKTGEKKLFLTLDNVYREHYHNGEYHNGNLYIIRRMGDVNSADGSWSDELWRYNAQGQGTRLYSAKGLDFRVAPDESYAVVNVSAGSDDVNLVFVDAAGKASHQLKINPSDGNPYLAQSGAWSADSKSYWDILQIMAAPQAVVRIDATTWQTETYPISQLGFGRERDLNVETGQLVYSDYPTFFDADSAQKFTDSGKTVTLSIYDLKSQQTRTVATSAARKFEPKWLTNNSIEYNDPAGTGRIVYTVK